MQQSDQGQHSYHSRNSFIKHGLLWMTKPGESPLRLVVVGGGGGVETSL